VRGGNDVADLVPGEGGKVLLEPGWQCVERFVGDEQQHDDDGDGRGGMAQEASERESEEAD